MASANEVQCPHSLGFIGTRLEDAADGVPTIDVFSCLSSVVPHDTPPLPTVRLPDRMGSPPHPPPRGARPAGAPTRSAWCARTRRLAATTACSPAAAARCSSRGPWKVRAPTSTTMSTHSAKAQSSDTTVHILLLNTAQNWITNPGE